MSSKHVDSQCMAFQSAIDILSKPWNGLILNVMQAGPLRFSEIADRAKGPGDKVLSARLKDLEARGLLIRRVEHGPPVRVSYELTPKGCSFKQLAFAIEQWGRELGVFEKEKARR